jgi:hypothetical protein
MLFPSVIQRDSVLSGSEMPTTPLSSAKAASEAAAKAAEFTFPIYDLRIL